MSPEALRLMIAANAAELRGEWPSAAVLVAKLRAELACGKGTP